LYKGRVQIRKSLKEKEEIRRIREKEIRGRRKKKKI